MIIFIETLTNIFSLDIYNQDSILHIKEQIQCITNIHVNNQCLIFNKQKLDNIKTIQTYNIENESKIYLVIIVPYLTLSKVGKAIFRNKLQEIKLNHTSQLQE